MGNITSKTLCPCLWRENSEPSIKHRYHTLLQDLEEIEAAVVTHIQSKHGGVKKWGIAWHRSKYARKNVNQNLRHHKL